MVNATGDIRGVSGDKHSGEDENERTADKTRAQLIVLRNELCVPVLCELCLAQS